MHSTQHPVMIADAFSCVVCKLCVYHDQILSRELSTSRLVFVSLCVFCFFLYCCCIFVNPSAICLYPVYKPGNSWPLLKHPLSFIVWDFIATSWCVYEVRKKGKKSKLSLMSFPEGQTLYTLTSAKFNKTCSQKRPAYTLGHDLWFIACHDLLHAIEALCLEWFELNWFSFRLVTKL